MYGRLSLLQGRPGDRARMEPIADRFLPLLQQQTGFQDVTFFLDERSGLYGSFSRWDTREDAEAAGDAMQSELQQAVAEVGLLGPQIRIVEIYEPGG
jgi:heme-degrading monooxygenase HmoA